MSRWVAQTIEDRFWAKADGGGYRDCWIWTAALNESGYGVFVPQGTRTVKAHRWAYEFIFGAILGDLHLDHLCRNRACVNPWHLEPVTNLVNSRRGKRPNQTHCLRGHPFSPNNTRWRGNMRNCKACDLERNRTRYRKRKGLAA